MHILKKFKNDTSGSVFILTGVAAAVMVSLAGMSVDLGMTIIERDRAQNAIDAGVVSGAIRASLGAPEAEVKDAAESYYQMNLPGSKLTFDKSSWDIDSKTGTVSRKLDGDLNTFFRAGNRSALSVDVEASATPSLMKASRSSGSGTIPPVLSKPVIADIILVLDNSSSMKGSPISSLRKAASNFLQEAFSANNTGNGTYRVGIIGFDTNVIAQHNISDNYTSLQRTVSKLKTGSGTSTVGIKRASEMLNKSPDDGRKKVVVIMTDGKFNQGGGQNGAISECNKLKKKKNVIIQTVYFGGNSKDPDLKAMQQCPTQNGRFSFVTNEKELSDALDKAIKDTPTLEEVEPEPVTSEIRLTL